MSDFKITEAAKRSADPAQQHLREQKAIWNEAAKSLIAKLIYLKRGMNGRGEPKAGLPPSKIQFPLPPEIPSYLDSIATDFAAIVDGAEAIIREQEHYSQVRRKPQAVQPAPAPQVPAATDDGLVTQASWFGSRLWARTFGLSGKGKEYLVDMMDHANDIRKELENLENVLTSSDPNSIATAVNAAGALGLSSISSFTKSLDKLSKLHEDIKKKEEESRASNPNSESVVIPPPLLEEKSDPIEPKVEEQQQAKPAKFTHEQLQIMFSDAEGRFKLVKDDLAKGNKVIELAKLNASNLMEKSDNEYWSSLLNNLAEVSGVIHNTNYKLTRKNSEARRTQDPDKLAQATSAMGEAWTSYVKLLYLCGNALGIEINKEWIQQSIGFKMLNQALAQKNVKIEKDAGVKSYLKKRWMKFVNTIISDKTETVKLQCLDSIVVALDRVNILMNAIEKPGSNVSEIQAETSAAFRELSNVYAAILTLADLHNTEYEQEKINRKRKNIILYQIKENSISKLKKSISILSSYIKSPENSDG